MHFGEEKRRNPLGFPPSVNMLCLNTDRRKHPLFFHPSIQSWNMSVYQALQAWRIERIVLFQIGFCLGNIFNFLAFFFFFWP